MNGWWKSVPIIVGMFAAAGGAVAWADNNFVRQVEFDVVRQEVLIGQLKDVERELWERQEQLKEQPSNSLLRQRIRDLESDKRILDRKIEKLK